MQSIEGFGIKLQSQKISPKFHPPKRAIDKNNTTHLVFPITLEINGSGEIIFELYPKEYLFIDSSLINKGDSVSGKKLWGFSTSPLKQGSVKKGGEARSSGHTRQHVSIEGICFLSLIESYSGNIEVKKHPQDFLLR